LPIVENGYLVGLVTAADVLDAEIRESQPPVHRLEATAADAMTERPWTCLPTDSLVDAAKLMVDFEVRHLPVVDHGELVGMLSDRDLRTIVGAPVRFIETGDRALTVRDAMTRNPVTVRSDRPLRDVASELAEDSIGALPVVDPAGKLVGIISYVDALRWLAA
jgi:acetoin utilization protein AcuB